MEIISKNNKLSKPEEPTKQDSLTKEEQEQRNEPIIGTAYVARYENEKWFATYGRYQVSKRFTKLEDLKKSLKHVTQEQLLVIHNTLLEYMEEQLNTFHEKLNKDLNN